jgi:hypothetical protein
LAIAKYASTVALMLTIGWLAALFWVILDNTPNTSVAHTIVEVILTVRFYIRSIIRNIAAASCSLFRLGF